MLYIYIHTYIQSTTAGPHHPRLSLSLSLSLSLYIYIYIHTHTHAYINIYTKREKGCKEGERGLRDLCTCPSILGALSLLCLHFIAAYVVCARVQPVKKPHVSELQKI